MATYYVYPGLATGTNAGTSWTNAWQAFTSINWATLQAAAAGEPTYLYVKKGTIARIRLQPTGSGSSDTNRIIVTTDSTDTGINPIIRMSTVVTGVWTDEGGGVYSIQPAGWARDSLGCFVDITTSLVKGGSAALSAGQFWIDTTTAPDTLYVRLSDDGDPAGHTIELSNGENCIYIGAYSYLTYSNMTLQHADAATGAIRVFAAATFSTFESLDFEYLPGGGIAFGAAAGGGNIVQRCTFHDIWNGKAYGAGGTGTAFSSAAGAQTFRYNRIERVYQGMTPTGGGAGTYIYYNVILDYETNAISVTSSVASPVYVLNNSINHNPTYTGGHAIAEQGVDDDTSIYIQNNAITSNIGNAIYLNRSTFTQVTINNNIYNITGGITTFRLAGNTYATLALWQVAIAGTAWTGKDAASLSADPLFLSATDYHLQSSSPAINAGGDVGLSQDFDGSVIKETNGQLSPRTGGVFDIGAYEFDSLPPPRKVPGIGIQ